MVWAFREIVNCSLVCYRYGRKIVMYVSLLVMIATSIGLSWAHTYWLFVLIQFVLGASIVAMFMPAYIICKFRVQIIAIWNLCINEKLRRSWVDCPVAVYFFTKMIYLWILNVWLVISFQNQIELHVHYSSCISALEFTSAKKRVWPGVISDFPYVLGLVLLSAIAYFLKDWFKIQLYTSLPGIVFISYWWLVFQRHLVSF